jgi:NAD(P)-dependent dehydrogenase (short-subunit alcohol dehydrogenase family)
LTDVTTRKTALVTGGNRGLGLVAAEKLAARGFDVVITAREPAQAERALGTIRRRAPGATVDVLPLDLASHPSVRSCADHFLASARPIHALVLNAGVMTQDPKIAFTADGFEVTLGTNHVGHFLLTHLLLPRVCQSAPSRIVVVASQMHRAGVGEGAGPDFDYGNLRGERSFDPVVAYRNSKLANLWFTFELARRLQGTGVTVNAVCPGFVPATIADRMPHLFQRLVFRFVLPRMKFARTPDQGGENTARTAADPALDGVTGRFFVDLREAEASDEARDPARAARLWDESCRWCGIERFGES